MGEWISVHVRNVRPGDVVRVRENAYSGSTGEMHNGRVCEVLLVQGGDVVVKSIDGKLPVLSKTYHSPIVLEKEVNGETIN
jgi:hypothetical protein